MNQNNKDFKSLQDKWYKKLKDSGFEDLERKGGKLKNCSLKNIAFYYDQSTFQLKQDYYRMAGIFLNEHTFDTKKDKLIWELHSNGVSIRNIVLQLKKRGYKAYKRMVHEIIQKLVVLMYLSQI